MSDNSADLRDFEIEALGLARELEGLKHVDGDHVSKAIAAVHALADALARAQNVVRDDADIERLASEGHKRRAANQYAAVELRELRVKI